MITEEVWARPPCVESVVKFMPQQGVKKYKGMDREGEGRNGPMDTWTRLIEDVRHQKPWEAPCLDYPVNGGDGG
jgi:hypothetical protein